MLNKKAVALLSGGLDSTLAIKMIQEQGIEVFALNFSSAFCTCDSRKEKIGCSEALYSARKLGIPVKVVPKGLEYLEIVKNPKYGYGRAMNPCIDCRIYIFRKAKEYMEEIGASFVISGEVLNQRPKSQKRNFLKIIEKESHLEGLIVRPLSAEFLEPTIPEKEGIIDRTKLFGIEGKSRKKQIALAKQLGISDYPCASGGCRLTEKEYAKKVHDYLYNEDDYSLLEVQLLRYGRHIRIKKNHKIILGKNKYENAILSRLRPKNSILIEPEFPGPVALLTGHNNYNFINKALAYIVKYTKPEKLGNTVVVRSGSYKHTLTLSRKIFAFLEI